MSGVPADWASRAAIDVMTGRAVPLSATRTTYLALLTTEVDFRNATMATLPEVTTTGYIRQPVTWTAPVYSETAQRFESANASNILFGPFATEMLAAATAAVLVTAVTGTNGTVVFGWRMDEALTAGLNESIQIPAGMLVLAHN